MHWIQKHILKKLAVNDSLKYTELKPETVEGNLFTYHLNQLVSDRFVKKDGNSYDLTDLGKNFVSSMSMESGSTRKQPKIVVMFITENNKGEYLLFKWSRQPYRGLVSFPFGRVHYGKSVLELAQNELTWKTGLQGDLAYLGDIYVQTGTLDHYLAHIFRVENIEGELGSSGLQGKPLWEKLENLKESEFIPGFKKLVKVVENQKPPFLEEIITK